MMMTTLTGIPQCRNNLQKTSLHADTIEGLFEIYEVHIQGGLPLDALLRNHLQCCYFIRTASASSGARLFLSPRIQCSSSAILMRSRITLKSQRLTCHVQQHDAAPGFRIS